VQGRDALDAEAGDLDEVENARGQLGAQPLQRRGAAGPVQLGDLGGERGADAGDLGQALSGDERREVARQRLDRRRPPLIGPGAVGVAALDLEQERDLAQRRRNLQTVRRGGVGH